MDRTRHRRRDGSRRYGRDETADILDLAAALETSEDDRRNDLTRGDLYRIADELGISSASIDAAIAGRAKASSADMRASKKSIRRRMRFIRHASAYAVTVAILAALDALGGGGWWFFYVAAIWGIVLALHATRFATRRDGPLERRIAAKGSVEPQ